MGTVRDALQLPDMRRIELGYGLSITGELAGTVALVVYALSAGGAATGCCLRRLQDRGRHGGGAGPDRYHRPGAARSAAALDHRRPHGLPGGRGAAGRVGPAARRGHRGRRRQLGARGHLPSAAGCRAALAGAHAGRARRVECRHRRDGELRGPGRAAAGRRPARRGRPGRCHGRGGRRPGRRGTVAAAAHRPRHPETPRPRRRSGGPRRHQRPGRVRPDGPARRCRDLGVRPDLAPRRAGGADRRARRPRPGSGRVRGRLAHRCLRRGWPGRRRAGRRGGPHHPAGPQLHRRHAAVGTAPGLPCPPAGRGPRLPGPGRGGDRERDRRRRRASPW